MALSFYVAPDVIQKLTDTKIELSTHHDPSFEDWAWWACNPKNTIDLNKQDIDRSGTISFTDSMGVMLTEGQMNDFLLTNGSSSLIEKPLHEFVKKNLNQHGVGTDLRKYIEVGLGSFSWNRDNLHRSIKSTSIATDLIIENKTKLKIIQHATYSSFSVGSPEDVWRCNYGTVNLTAKLSSTLYLDNNSQVQYQVNNIELIFNTLEDYDIMLDFLSKQSSDESSQDEIFKRNFKYFDFDRVVKFNFSKNTFLDSVSYLFYCSQYFIKSLLNYFFDIFVKIRSGFTYFPSSSKPNFPVDTGLKQKGHAEHNPKDATEHSPDFSPEPTKKSEVSH